MASSLISSISTSPSVSGSGFSKSSTFLGTNTTKLFQAHSASLCNSRRAFIARRFRSPSASLNHIPKQFKEVNLQEGYDCDIGDDNEIHPSTSTSSMQTTTSGSRKKKRRRVAESMEENMLMGMVEAAKEIAKALKPQKCDHIERALRQLPDMTDNQVFDGMDLLGPDPQLTKVFFGLSEDSSRKA